MILLFQISQLDPTSYLNKLFLDLRMFLIKFEDLIHEQQRNLVEIIGMLSLANAKQS